MTARDALEYILIADIAVDANIRKNTKITQSWVSSIRNHGIINPAIGWRDDEGVIHLTDGQRRYLAAVDIGLSEMPVIVKPKEIADEARVLAQLTLNEQRERIDDGEHMSAIAELADFGVTATLIARKTNQPRAFVDQALTVANNPTAAASIKTHTLTLDQAAVIAELSDDPADVAKLEQAAIEDPARFEHTAQRIRDDRAEAIAKTELREQIKAAGAEEITAFHDQPSAERIMYLWRADDPKQTRITIDDIPGYADVVASLSHGWTGPETRGWMISWGIRGWKAQGLATFGNHTAGGPLTDDEKAARKAKREAKAAMTSATVVRRAWIHDHLLNHRQLNGTEYVWIALAAIGAPGTLKAGQGDAALDLAAEMLGIHVEDGPNQWIGDAMSTPTTRALAPDPTGRDQLRNPLRIALAVAIAHTEGVVGNPRGDSFGQDPRAAIYLEQLAAWGYPLADVEQAIVTAAAKAAAKKAAADAKRAEQ